jgi:hypothetical protein
MPHSLKDEWASIPAPQPLPLVKGYHINQNVQRCVNHNEVYRKNALVPLSDPWQALWKSAPALTLEFLPGSCGPLAYSFPFFGAAN